MNNTTPAFKVLKIHPKNPAGKDADVCAWGALGPRHRSKCLSSQGHEPQDAVACKVALKSSQCFPGHLEDRFPLRGKKQFYLFSFK